MWLFFFWKTNTKCIGINKVYNEYFYDFLPDWVFEEPLESFKKKYFQFLPFISNPIVGLLVSNYFFFERIAIDLAAISLSYFILEFGNWFGNLVF